MTIKGNEIPGIEMSVTQTLQRLDRTLDTVFPTPKTNFLSTEFTQENVDIVNNLMDQYRQEIEIMKQEMTKFDDTMQEFKSSQDATGQAHFKILFEQNFKDMQQSVAILFFSFEEAICPLMKLKTLKTPSGSSEKIVRYVELLNCENVQFRFELLKHRTASLAYFPGLHTNEGRMPVDDTTVFSASMATLNTVIQSLQDQLVPVAYTGLSRIQLWDFAPGESSQD